jgi:PTH1 family peptidyl-tRNA hydrolase
MIYTIIPLGNPGEKYARTRHNVARILLDMIKDDIKSLDSCELFIPETFMNESGKAVSEYLRYHEGREIIVIHDDKDLPYETFRISFDRGDGGHNGVKSIIESLGRGDFIRIRIGIRPTEEDGKETLIPVGELLQDFVMGRVSFSEEESLRKIAPQVLGAIKTITEEDYVKAMERYNGIATSQ